MSNPNLIVLPEAEGDISGVLQYTLETWGWDQFLAMAAEIQDTLEMIPSHQMIGRSRLELPNNMRSFAMKQHIVFYYIEGKL